MSSNQASGNTQEGCRETYNAGRSQATTSHDKAFGNGHLMSKNTSNNAGTTSSGDANNTRSTSSSATRQEQQSSEPFSFSKEQQNQYLYCPYHGLAIHMPLPSHRQRQQLSPMDRFLAEGPSVQPSLHIREGNGKLSTVRDCKCRTRMEIQSYRPI